MGIHQNAWFHAVVALAPRAALAAAAGSSRTPGVLRARLLGSSRCAASPIVIRSAATTSVEASTCTDVESSIDLARITMIRCLPHGRFCQLPASRTTRHAHRHCCSPGRCAATCLTSQPHQARLCDTKRNNIPSAASASRSPHAATHGRLGTRSLPSLHAATRSLPSLYAVARSLPSPYTATWPPHAPCYTHSRRYTPTRRYTLAATGTRRHARGHRHTPSRALPLPHAAALSLPSPHAAAQLSMGHMARMLHVLCTVSRELLSAL